MKQRTLLAIIVGVVIVIAGAFLYLALQPKPAADNQDDMTNNSQNNSETMQPAPSDPGDQTPAPTTGKYVDYSETTFADATAAKRILFFHAPWCPQCRALEKSILEGPIPAGMVILKVDYDTSQNLRQTYGVTLQTTLVEVDKKGEFIKKYIAYDEPALASIKREFE